MTNRGKKYTDAVKLENKAESYPPQEAVELMKKMVYAKFDETAELHLRMGVDPRDATQQVRGVALLPHGLGKKIRVLVFAQGEAEKIASSSGADVSGGDDLIKKIEGGWLEFDVAIATPDMMGKIGKLGKIMGRKGLMPNPKAGTVVPASDLPRVIADSHKGKVEFKVDRTSIIHVPFGKASFEAKNLSENLTTIIEAVMKARPSGVKGQYVKTAFIKTTMGPSVRLDLKVLGTN